MLRAPCHATPSPLVHAAHAVLRCAVLWQAIAATGMEEEFAACLRKAHEYVDKSQVGSLIPCHYILRACLQGARRTSCRQGACWWVGLAALSNNEYNLSDVVLSVSEPITWYTNPPSPPLPHDCGRGGGLPGSAG